jgi:hypothetical protein
MKMGQSLLFHASEKTPELITFSHIPVTEEYFA